MSAPVVLVTGARKGIGRALVEHFVEAGAIVEGCSRSEPDWSLDGYRHHIVDILDEKQVRSMTAAIAERHGRLDVTVNNAGVASMNHSLLMPAATARWLLDTNVVGAFNVCRESAKLMKRNKYGRIINMGSVAPALRIEGEAMYAASKSALLTFTQIFAREVAPFGITCNVVAPTPIETDLIRSVPPEKIQALVDQLVVKRLGTFADVANVVDFFASPASDYVTGQLINLGGA
ncbi:MAG: SDR family oxidoreductase [Ilumatobacter sp.]|nr:SDR family oxidoreductase [Ilumatobacter sp.]